MLKIIFSEDGKSISDFEVRSKAKDVIENYLKEKKDVEIFVSNECYFDTFVLYTMKGIILKEEIEFYFGDVKLDFDECCGTSFPNGVSFNSVHTDILSEIIDIGCKNMLKGCENND